MKHFIFDADGVLCIGSPFTSALKLEHGLDIKKLDSFFAGPFRECISGARDLKAELATVLLELKWTGTVDDFLRFWFEREHVISPTALAGARQLRLQGHRCHVGTNQEKYRAAYLWNEMGFKNDFERLFASCELGAAKPSPEFYVRVRDALGCAHSDIVLIDDAEKNVHAARMAGWHAIHYRRTDDLDAVFRLATDSV